MHCPMYYHLKKICILSLIYVAQLAHLTLVQMRRYFPKCISDAVGIFPFLIMIKYCPSDVLFCSDLYSICSPCASTFLFILLILKMTR